MLRFVVFLSLVFMFFAPQANAGTRSLRNTHMWERQLTQNTQRYTSLVNQLYQTPESFYSNIAALRSIYPQTRQYAPFSKKIIRSMTEYAYIADTSPDNMTVNKALANYNGIVKNHLVNLEVLELALTLSHANVQFGNSTFFEKVYDNLTQSIISGYDDGLSPQSAPHVVTYGEESFILAQFGGIVLKSELFEIGKLYYNVHDIVIKHEDDNDEQFQVFINITTPMDRMLKTQKLQETKEKITIPKR